MDELSIADELYGLAPEDFVRVRTEREKQARAVGDRELAAAIHRMGRPSVAAWLANQLVREHRDEIGPLLELGAALREATASLSGDALRELSGQQRVLVSALVRQARQSAAASGRRVSEDNARDLEATLHAALADAGAAEQLAAGHLTQPLRVTGFDLLQGGAVADLARTAATVPASPPAPVSLQARKVQKADRAVEQATELAREATELLRMRQEEAAVTAESRAESQDDVARLEAELSAARDVLARREATCAKALEAVAGAQAELERRSQALADARSARAALSG